MVLIEEALVLPFGSNQRQNPRVPGSCKEANLVVQQQGRLQVLKELLSKSAWDDLEAAGWGRLDRRWLDDEGGLLLLGFEIQIQAEDVHYPQSPTEKERMSGTGPLISHLD